MSGYKRVPVCGYCGKKINRNQKAGVKIRINKYGTGHSETVYFHSPECYYADESHKHADRFAVLRHIVGDPPVDTESSP